MAKKAPALTLAEIDSHHATMNIHREVASDAAHIGAWDTAINSLNSALKHANKLQDAKARSDIFGKLNVARAKQRKARATTVQSVAA